MQRLGSGGERPLGVSVLDDLQVTMSRDDIARYLVGYGAGTGYDSSTGRPGRLPLPTHWAAIIGWLRPGKLNAGGEGGTYAAACSGGPPKDRCGTALAEFSEHGQNRQPDPNDVSG